jgi:uncharacterized protein with HEPN domain
MTGAGPRLADYLEHIAAALNRIDRYVAGLDEAALGRSD